MFIYRTRPGTWLFTTRERALMRRQWQMTVMLRQVPRGKGNKREELLSSGCPVKCRNGQRASHMLEGFVV
jgi:hypothetical protein